MTVIRLGRRLLARGDVMAAFAVVAAPMAVLLATYMTISALTLSPSQYANSQFGRFAGLVELGSTRQTRSHLPAVAVLREIRSLAPAGQSALVIRSYDLGFNGMSQYRGANYIEADWARLPFPGEFTVLAGRMPRRAGQIAVAQGLFPHPLGKIVTAASGNARLKVVGVIRDRFSRASADVLAAPGTWATFNWHNLNRQGFSVDPTVEMLGNFHDWARLARISATYQAHNLVGGGGALVTVSNRRLVAADPPQSFVQTEPLLYRVPEAVVAALCPLLLLALRGRRARRWAGVLRATGVRNGRATAAILGGSLLLVICALPAGAVLGEALGLVVRPLADGLSNQPLSPPASVLPGAARFAAIAAVAGLAAAVAVSAHHRVRSVRELLVLRPSPRVRASARWFGVLLLACVSAFLGSAQPSGTNNAEVSVALTLAACLLIPDLLHGLLQACRRSGLRWRLVTRRLMVDLPKSCAVCATLVVGFGPFVALSAEHTANLVSQRRNWDYEIPPGEVAVQSTPGGDSHHVDRAALRLIVRATGQNPIPIMALSSSALYNANPRYAMLAPGGRAPQQGQALLAVGSVAALRELLGTRLTAQGASVVAGGGVLEFGPAPARAPIGLVQETNQGVALRRATVPVAVASIPNDHGWAEQTTGFTLTSTARRLRLPMYTYFDAFTDISSAENRALARVIEQAGLPIQVLLQPSPFQSEPLPPALVYGRYGVLALLLVVMVVSLGATARSLRRESRSLLAIGLRSSWARGALVRQSLTMVIVGLVLGLLVGMVAYGIYTVRIPGAPAVFPSEAMTIVGGGALVIAVLTTWLSARQLSPRGSQGPGESY